MPRTHLSDRIRTKDTAPCWIGLGLAVVLLAQIWPTIPLAAAIAMIGLGATQSLKGCRGAEWPLPINWLIYATLVSTAIFAQFDLRVDVTSVVDTILASGITVASTRISFDLAA